jgi:preprotein translocase subunit SecF
VGAYSEFMSFPAIVALARDIVIIIAGVMWILGVL